MASPVTRHTVTVPASRGLLAYLAELADRAEAVRAGRVRARTDNLLRIAADSRAATLDLRLVGRRPHGTTKLDIAAARVAAALERPATVDGRRLQIVYADRTAPAPDGWRLHQELHARLVACGVPDERIGVDVAAGRAPADTALLAACRNGTLGVLVTTSSRVDPRVPMLAAALHHLDTPPTSADLHRREAGLHAPSAGVPPEVYRYLTDGVLDPYLWHLVTGTGDPAFPPLHPTAPQATPSVSQQPAGGRPPPAEFDEAARPGQPRPGQRR